MAASSNSNGTTTVPTPKQFEYAQWTGPDVCPADRLKTMGDAGWELVSCVASNQRTTGEVVYTVKRAK